MSNRNVSEPLMKTLEAMSLLYEICLKKEQYNIDPNSDLYRQILKAYNDLQIIRDDSTFIPIETDLSDSGLKQLKANRVKELTSQPFNTTKDGWIK
jgi:hypothetical protein